MRIPALFLSVLLLTSGATAQEVKAPAQPTVIYLVRHAEKEGDKGDVPLSKDGEKRAETLKGILTDVPLSSVHATDTIRTKTTARPTAKDHELRGTTYDSEQSNALLDTLVTKGGHHLVVGHSNTLGQMVDYLGGEPGNEVGYLEYDRLYVVHKNGSSTASSLLRYGEPSQRAK